MKKILLTVPLVLISFELLSQDGTRSLLQSTTVIGSSATSAKPLTAITFSIASFSDASLQAGLAGKHICLAASGNYAGDPGFVAAINEKDSLLWLKRPGAGWLYSGRNTVFVCNENGSGKLNVLNGSTDFNFSGKPLFIFESQETGLFFDNGNPGQLTALDLGSGKKQWDAVVPGTGKCAGTLPVGDSLLLVAADGLFALHEGKGLVWSHTLSTEAPAENPSAVTNTSSERLRGKRGFPGMSCRGTFRAGSGILRAENLFYTAGTDQVIAVDEDGRIAWKFSLTAFPVSEIGLIALDSVLFVVNTGALLTDSAVISSGTPFVLRLDRFNGKLKGHYNSGAVLSMRDFLAADSSLIIAGQESISAIGVSGEVRNLAVIDPSYGHLTALVDGDAFYMMREGYFKPLNSARKLLHYMSDNGKVYAVENMNIKYEINSGDLYQLDRKWGEHLILVNPLRTIMVSPGYELMYVFNTTGKNLLSEKKLYFLEEQALHVVNLPAPD